MLRLEGSCACRAVRFAADSQTPYPYMRCYCSICRKSAGAGGYAINVMAQAATLEVEGGDHVSFWQARIDQGDGPAKSPAKRHFCARCGSALWVADPRWPEWIYPFAGAIDTPLPAPPERVHIMLASRAPWAQPCGGDGDSHYDEYPDESIIDWHRNRGLDQP